MTRRTLQLFWMHVAILIGIAFLLYPALKHTPAPATIGVPIQGAEATFTGKVTDVTLIGYGGTDSVIVVGDTPILLSAKTHMMLKSGLTNLVGHEVWVHGVRINNGVSAYVLYELETL
jgi:hypothetical protein